MTGCTLVGSGGTSPREWSPGVTLTYMIAHAGTLLRPALYLPRRAPVGLAALFCRQAIARIAARRRKFAFPLKLAASALAGALATLAIMDYQDGRQDVAASSVRNETVVYRQARTPQAHADQAYSEHPYTEQVEASDELEDENVPSNYPRMVQTVRFVNPDAPVSIGAITAAAGHSIRQALVKVGGFVAFSRKEDAEADASKKTIPPRQPA